MPDSFFGKLNTLVKAHINNVLDPIDEKSSKSRKKALSRQEIRGGLQGDVKLLRQRIDDALKYEGELQAKVDALYKELSEQDAKADAAVQEGRENDARFALGRIQQAQREIEMLEADLREHRSVTQELISQVNMLDSTIQAVEGEETSQQESSAEPTTEDLGAAIIKSLDSTRENLRDLISTYTSKVTGQEEKPKQIVVDEEPDPNKDKVKHPVDSRKVDDEYSARLSRLSKPDDKK
jgi:phage shock protein A